MYIQNTTPAVCGQANVVDILEVLQLIDTGLSFEEHARVALFLDSFLPNCKAPLLDELLKLAPDAPLGPPEGEIMAQERGVGWVLSERKRWPKSVLARRQKFPGYHPSHWKHEDMKFGNRPQKGAPLSEWVAKLINHAKAKWCGEIGAKRIRLQFKSWLPFYLKDKRLCWYGSPERDAAIEILKVACRLSGLASA